MLILLIHFVLVQPVNLNDINVANGLSVSGSATINSLNVLGASTLLSMSVANDLNVNGKIYQNGQELELSTIWLLSGSNIIMMQEELV